jgi:hypothetical protein
MLGSVEPTSTYPWTPLNTNGSRIPDIIEHPVPNCFHEHTPWVDWIYAEMYCEPRPDEGGTARVWRVAYL